MSSSPDVSTRSPGCTSTRFGMYSSRSGGSFSPPMTTPPTPLFSSTAPAAASRPTMSCTRAAWGASGPITRPTMPREPDHRHVRFDAVGRTAIDHHFERTRLRIAGDDARRERRGGDGALQVQRLLERARPGRLRLFLLELSLELDHPLT